MYFDEVILLVGVTGVVDPIMTLIHISKLMTCRARTYSKALALPQPHDMASAEEAALYLAVIITLDKN